MSKIKLTEQSRANMLKWVEALESDEYDQGVGALEYRAFDSAQPRNCCLGVLCRVANNNGQAVEIEYYNFHPANGSGIELGTRFSGSVTSAPTVVLNWLFTAEDFINGALLDQNVLIRMNDNLLRDFHDIAAYLRDTYDLDG